jgi:hypothetical protein
MTLRSETLSRHCRCRLRCEVVEDPNDSVPDQQRQAVAQIEREGDRVLYAEPFGEASASGWSGDRGPQLTAALAAAVAAADEHGSAELWVFHSSRLGRGSGRKAEARSAVHPPIRERPALHLRGRS